MQAFTQIQIEMRSQYLIGYEPINQKRDGSYRKIEVQLANSDLTKEKVKLTHRQGYFAKTDAAAPPRLRLIEKGRSALKVGDRVLARTEEGANGWRAHPMKKLPARAVVRSMN